MQESESNNQLDHFISKCRQYNLRITPQRIAIYKQLLESENHPTADNLFQSIRNEFPNISFDTVNRTLLTFSKIGIIHTVESHSGARRFDPNLKEHHHLHCIKCGKITDFFNERYNQLEIPKEIQKQYTIVRKRMVLNTICRNCNN